VAGKFCLFSLVFVRIVTTACWFQVKFDLHDGFVWSGYQPIAGCYQGHNSKKSQTHKNRPGGKIGDGLFEIPFPYL
jgi:hypothetical protein